MLVAVNGMKATCSDPILNAYNGLKVQIENQNIMINNQKLSIENQKRVINDQKESIASKTESTDALQGVVDFQMSEADTLKLPLNDIKIISEKLPDNCQYEIAHTSW